jgi:RNAse (barnase) inhibitor barstar
MTPEFHLDAATWKTTNDVYDALFATIGAPAWHGRNFDALNDSIVTGGINFVEVPYRIAICNLADASPQAQALASNLMQLFIDFQTSGCPVSMRLI